MKIMLNAAKCKNCKVVVISLTTHDFRTCKCGMVSVDGGREYLKRCGSPENIEELSIVARLDNEPGHKIPVQRFYTVAE